MTTEPLARPEPVAVEGSTEGAAGFQINVKAKNGSHSFVCEPGERILYAGLRQGVPLPYECATGTCGTCKGRCSVPGAIEETWAAAPGRAYLRAERGEFLMCQAVARQDCNIDVPARLTPPFFKAALPHYDRGVIGNRKVLTEDVISFRVALASRTGFEAGQFYVVATGNLDGFRAYSMVNYDPTTEHLDFVIKKKPGGLFSDWIFQPEAEGAELEVFGPLGRAVFLPEEGKNLLAVAGGSGIAGIMGILERAQRENYFLNHEGDVFFGVRTPRDAFYLEEMSAYVAAAQGRLRVTYALSHEEMPGGVHPDYPGIRFATGFVHSAAAEAMAGKYQNLVAFIAGPPPMVDGALRMLIVDARLPASDIRYDKFG